MRGALFDRQQQSHLGRGAETLSGATAETLDRALKTELGKMEPLEKLAEHFRKRLEKLLHNLGPAKDGVSCM